MFQDFMPSEVFTLNLTNLDCKGSSADDGIEHGDQKLKVLQNLCQWNPHVYFILFYYRTSIYKKSFILPSVYVSISEVS